MKNKKQDPYEVQLADLANEIGGNMAVEYYNVSFTLTKEQLPVWPSRLQTMEHLM